MKINVTVDCTPDEARQFLGLPDVAAFQSEMTEVMRKKILDSMTVMEPAEAMKAWAPMMNQSFTAGAQQMQDFFAQVMTGAAKSKK